MPVTFHANWLHSFCWFLCLQLLSVSCLTPRGDHVCVKQVSVTKSKTVDIDKPFTFREDVWTLSCLCYKTVERPGVKRVKVQQNYTETVEEPVCCEGFAQVGDACIPICNPSLSASLHPDCYNASTNNLANVSLLAAGQEDNIALIPAVVVVLLVLISLILVGTVFYYRRKYRKAKDPELPTVVYNTSEYSTSTLPDNEFDNPMYNTPSKQANGINNPMAGSSFWRFSTPKDATLRATTNDSLFLTQQQKALEKMKLAYLEDASGSEKSSSSSGSETGYEEVVPKSSDFNIYDSIQDNKKSNTIPAKVPTKASPPDYSVDAAGLQALDGPYTTTSPSNIKLDSSTSSKT